MNTLEAAKSSNTNEMAEFDGTVPNTIFDWTELIPTLIIYGFSFILGLIGNCLIIFTTFRYRRMHSVTNIFLSSLASSDLLLIIFCIPVKVAKLFSYTWTMGLFLCKSVHYMQNLSTICSVLTLTAISIERYYAIVHPVRSKYICTLSQAKSIIIVIWIVSIFLAVPTLFLWHLMRVGMNDEFAWCVRDSSKETLWKFHELYMLWIILVGPFSVMSYSYVFICWEVWKVMEHRRVMCNDNSLDPNKFQHRRGSMEGKKIRSEVKNYRDDTTMVRQVIYMLVTVVALFAVCWTPILIDNILTAYKVLGQQRTGFLKYMLSTFHLLSYFNSCINPVIYGFMSKTFRESFKVALCCSPDKASFHRTGSNYSMRFISRNGSQTRTTADVRRQESSMFIT
ncbi:QRFP-like peptide receptor [Anthonomus grandis grandis]|uniref:QRFP-like peptide receptor n=1 Tax=Anthonomus grandis grandis TaxID=2921223 RepID=UPI0021663480|nr:QRFP-like peptide receptor [Anthonomus grandis grandis]XP_050314606.1 QRFP-like peptide receptor [Anthonomus grandis grandis]